MKKLVSIFLIAIICFAVIPAHAFAEGKNVSESTRDQLFISWSTSKQHSFSDASQELLSFDMPDAARQPSCGLKTAKVSKEEKALYADVIKRILLSDDYQISILYDNEDAPSYIFSTCKNGYVILKRYTTIICECGETNPYEDYMDIKKYYGGALSYYLDASEYSDKTGAKIDNKYVDIINNVGSDNIKIVEFNEEDDENYIPTRFEICVIGDSYSYIRRRAFGYNDDNTCSAIACGIALNYIKHKFNINVVSNVQTSEYYNSGRATNASYVASSYPKAHSLHRALVEDYGMGAASYALGIVNPLTNYLIDMIPNASQRPTISWTYFPNFTTIKTNLLQSRPVLITTTSAGEFSWHTMVVYGFKIEEDSNLLLVHTGWYLPQYNTPLSSNSSYYYQNQVWINKNYATLGYYFSIPNN